MSLDLRWSAPDHSQSRQYNPETDQNEEHRRRLSYGESDPERTQDEPIDYVSDEARHTDPTRNADQVRWIRKRPCVLVGAGARESEHARDEEDRERLRQAAELACHHR